MLEECPHCYTGVFPSAAGECPSCRKNIHDRSGTDPNRTALAVSASLPLPEYCFACDLPTERRVLVKSRIPGEGSSGNETWPVAVFGALMSLIAPLVGFFERDADERSRVRSGETFQVQLPQCELCGAAGAPRPIRVDRDRGLLTFVVHVAFKKRVMPG